MKRLVFVGFFLIIVVIGIFLVRALFYQGTVRLNYVDRTDYPLQGLDISKHQGKINWEELRSEKLSFMIIKATEGSGYADSSFRQNYASSKAEGYKTGAYLFYRFCRDGKEQARFFIETVPRDSTDLPPSIDFEFGANCEHNKSHEQLVKEIQECLDVLEKHYKKRPIMYVTRSFYKEFMITDFKQYPLWIRSIYRTPKFREKRTWAVWQYANRARVKGVYKFVDLNVINGKSFDVLEAPVNNEPFPKK